MANYSKGKPFISAYNLVVSLTNQDRTIKNATFSVLRGEALTIIGEAGSGKTSLVKALIGDEYLDEGCVFWENSLFFGQNPNLVSNNRILKAKLNYLNKYYEDIGLCLEKKLSEYELRYTKFTQNQKPRIDTEQITNHLLAPSQDGPRVTNAELFSKRHYMQIEKMQNQFHDNSKVYYMLIEKLKDEIRFLRRVKKDDFIPTDLLDALINKLNDIAKRTKLLLFNQLDQNKILASIINVKKDLRDCEYEQIAPYFDELKLQLNFAIQQNKKAKNILKLMKRDYIFVKALLSNNSKRWKLKKEFESKIDKSVSENEVYQLAILNELLSMPNILKEINKNAKYKSPSADRLKEIFSKIRILSQDPNDAFDLNLTIKQVLDFTFKLHSDVIKSHKIRQSYQDWFIENACKNIVQDEKLKIKTKDIRNKFKLLILQCVGFDESVLSTRISNLTLAEKQRLYIAISLVARPDLTIYDEILSVVDAPTRIQILHVLKSIQKTFGLTYIFTEKNLEIAKIVSDRIAVIHKGRILELGTTNDIFNNPIHPYTKFIISSVINPDGSSSGEIMEYNPKKEHFDYEFDLPKWVEATKGHFIFANAREASIFRKK